MWNKTDRLAFLALAGCGCLIAFRFAWYFPGDYRLAFNWRAHTCCGTTMLFFVWNLFLAALPYAFSRLADGVQQYRLPFSLLLLLWLLFLPNAPYVISDLKHLRPRAGVPLLYDQVLFVACALTGLYLGAISVINVMRQTGWRRWSGQAKALSLLLFPLVGFGIFLGRVLRWNSWDLLYRPGLLLSDLFSVLSQPTNWPQILLFTLGYGAALWLATRLLLRKAT